jgi:plasmid stabilization system protein ParE
VNYWLHPEAQGDLREAAEFYREQAGTALSQSLLAEFERSVGLLVQYPRLGAIGRYANGGLSRDVSRSASSTPLPVIKYASSPSHTTTGLPAIGAAESKHGASGAQAFVRADSHQQAGTCASTQTPSVEPVECLRYPSCLPRNRS